MGLLQSLKAAGKAPQMDQQTLMAMYPDLFATTPQTPPIVPDQRTPPPEMASVPAPETGANGMPTTLTQEQYDVTAARLGKANTDAWMARNGVTLAGATPPAPTGPQYDTLPPTTEPAMQPEPAAVNAPAPTDSGPSEPVAASNAPAKRKGLLGFLGDVGGAIGSLIAPEPGSFMAEAYKNTIYGAKEGQQNYQREEAAKNLAAQEQAIKLRNLRTSGEYKIAGNNIFHIKPDGTTEIIQAPVQPGETERLIDLWGKEPNPEKKKLIEQAIRGYQWSPWVLDQLRKTRVAGAQASAAAKPPPGRIPPGFSLVE